MELDNRLALETDLQTETMIPIATDILCPPLEDTSIKQEPDFHTHVDSLKLTENTNYVGDVAYIVDIKTEIIGNGRCGNTHPQNNLYIDNHIRHGTHVAPEPTDASLETTDHNKCIIEIDTCKDEYYETHGYPINNATINFEEDGVEHEPGEACVTKEENMYMMHSDGQRNDVKSCTVVLRDIQYTYPDIETQASVNVHDREPTILLHVQSTEYVRALQQSKHKPHRCSVCGVGFTHKRNMNTHMKIHTGEKPHKCTVCEVSFTRKDHLASHMRTHTGEKPYKCPVCEAGFSEKGSLTHHTRIHTGEKPHKCSVCEVSFTLRGNLTRHMRTHTGEKPYKCSICGVDFSQKSSLMSHIRIHTGENPYICSVCGVGYAHKHHLKRHTRIHTGEKPYKCSVCDVSFTQKHTLTSHMRTHTGEKPYKCTVCGVDFSDKSNLMRHVRIHTVEKPHKCSVCGAEFTYKHHLESHTKTCTGEKHRI